MSGGICSSLRSNLSLGCFCLLMQSVEVYKQNDNVFESYGSTLLLHMLYYTKGVSFFKLWRSFPKHSVPFAIKVSKFRTSTDKLRAISALKHDHGQSDKLLVISNAETYSEVGKEGTPLVAEEGFSWFRTKGFESCVH
ncbi:hypothetical protein OROGR_001000 [Orobanche gracilis]